MLSWKWINYVRKGAQTPTWEGTVLSCFLFWFHSINIASNFQTPKYAQIFFYGCSCILFYPAVWVFLSYRHNYRLLVSELWDVCLDVVIKAVWAWLSVSWQWHKISGNNWTPGTISAEKRGGGSKKWGEPVEKPKIKRQEKNSKR